jgi:kynurenine formamidase
MRHGDLVCLPTYLAARDPRAFADPHVIDIDRQPRILAFGTGHHTCIGMHLARREIRIVLEAMLSRFKNIRIPDGETYRYHSGAAVVGIDYLSVEQFKKAGAPAHRALLSQGVVIIEGLNLAEAEPGMYEMYCLPLRVSGGDGAPARVILKR